MDKRERLEKEIAALKARLDRCFEKRLSTNDPETEVKLEELEDKLDADIKQKEQELAQLSDTPLDKNRSVLNLEEGLCSLDFDEPQTIVQDVLRYLNDNEGGAALFMMENCLEMEGSLLLRRVRDLLKSNTSQFFEYPVQFVPTLPANEIAFLKILGSHLGITIEEAAGDEPKKLAQATEAIIKKITTLLRSGTTILIPLANWKSLSLSGQVTFLEWFLNQFWGSLTNAVTEAMQDHSPRVFCVIMVDELIADTCRKFEYFCDFEIFDCGRLLMLPLRCWTKTDVQRWLGNYSSKLNKSERNHLVNYIFGGKDEELPLKVRIELEKAHAQSFF
ncbi:MULTISPECIES: hypothetical protein [Cyanophyceae]|uniref:Inactive STAND domain-containing protein n=1 Tax=Leptolyngbya subtilissima DQ-A4 TaxID=2933933 RepID=A0ABV0KC33_9CYAN|nr:hypothetical protein [Nodosilinea sp. FACHB-141]MBD2115087.1 hypothetical protein [Nodosilinea sp. FACHB-141]